MTADDECEGIWKKAVMAYRTFEAFNPREWEKLGNSQSGYFTCGYGRHYTWNFGVLSEGILIIHSLLFRKRVYVADNEEIVSYYAAVSIVRCTVLTDGIDCLLHSAYW